MYKTLDKSYYNYGNQVTGSCLGVIPSSGLASARLNNEGLKKEREASIERQKEILADYDVLVNSLWESLRFMRSQGFYSENSFQISATNHLQQALSEVLLRQKDIKAQLEGYIAEHESIGN